MGAEPHAYLGRTGRLAVGLNLAAFFLVGVGLALHEGRALAAHPGDWEPGVPELLALLVAAASVTLALRGYTADRAGARQLRVAVALSSLAVCSLILGAAGTPGVLVAALALLVGLPAAIAVALRPSGSRTRTVIGGATVSMGGLAFLAILTDVVASGDFPGLDAVRLGLLVVWLPASVLLTVLAHVKGVTPAGAVFLSLLPVPVAVVSEPGLLPYGAMGISVAAALIGTPVLLVVAAVRRARPRWAIVLPALPAILAVLLAVFLVLFWMAIAAVH